MPNKSKKTLKPILFYMDIILKLQEETCTSIYYNSCVIFIISKYQWRDFKVIQV